ncbi:Uncharacterized protein Fot_35558 [Forsythia ovata]|uniref:Uncharacterized protein n=1 Tax=Forsythia ovata TaxID=205694 RepID=A0ABD1SLW0_9LAMI
MSNSSDCCGRGTTRNELHFVPRMIPATLIDRCVTSVMATLKDMHVTITYLEIAFTNLESAEWVTEGTNRVTEGTDEVLVEGMEKTVDVLVDDGERMDFVQGTNGIMVEGMKEVMKGTDEIFVERTEMVME